MAILVAAACQRVPLLAPSGSTITLTSLATALPVNGSTQLIAQIIEPSGTPPHSGTHIIFTTSLGTIEPSEAETDISGRVVVTFKAGSSNGTAVITASSGGATVASGSALRIPVGTAAVGRIVLSANPTIVPATGGTSVISAFVSDINGNPLSSAQVAFSTSSGSIDPTLVTADASGVATSRLTTSTTATVTASVGASGGSTTGGGTTGGGTNNGGNTGGNEGGNTGGGNNTGATPTGQASATITVNIAAVPDLVITPPTTTPSAGLPATFTFKVTIGTNGSAVRDLTVNWGDGSPAQSLGAFGSSASGTTATVTHVYAKAGTYNLTATLIDATGNVATQQTSVVVIPVPRPTIIITPSPVPGKVNTQTNLQIQISVPNGISVQDVLVNFGDGQTADLGGVSNTVNVPHTYTSTGTFTVTVTVIDTSGQTTIGTTAVSIGP